MRRVLILSILAGAFLTADPAESKGRPGLRALVIANAAYQHSLPAVATRANAEAMAGVLSEVGFKSVVARDLTLADFGTTIRNFMDTVQPGDFVFIYFSGYGLQLDDANYLLPVNFDPREEGAPGQKAISVSFLLNSLQVRKAGTRMVVLDANRSCPGFPDGLLSQDPADKTLIAYAAAPKKIAADPAAGADLFTSTLAKMIREPGSTPRGVLDKTQAEVNRLTNGKQLPYVLASPVDEEFYFVEPVITFTPGAQKVNPKDGLVYVWIPEGTFKMGCVPGDKDCQKDEKPQHEVKITRGFWMTSTEVTTFTYKKFAQKTNHDVPKTKINPKLRGTDLPVTSVRWSDAADYCKSVGGRLPSEAEWEYAARAGKENQKYPWGNEFDAEAANWFRSKRDKDFPELVPVKTFGSANPYNLYDMAGNASEWANDSYDPEYFASPGPTVDPQGPATGKERVVKGGSFNDGQKELRISFRDHYNSTKQDNRIGFRCVVPALQ